jgi:hypothetical protein
MADYDVLTRIPKRVRFFPRRSMAVRAQSKAGAHSESEKGIRRRVCGKDWNGLRNSVVGMEEGKRREEKDR